MITEKIKKAKIGEIMQNDVQIEKWKLKKK